MYFRVLIGVGILSLSMSVRADGLTVGRDVPVPKEYEIRYGRDGRPYTVVRSFERRQTGAMIDIRSVGTVQRVRKAANHRDVVTLRGSSGVVLNVRTGNRFQFAGQTYMANGFEGDRYVVTCRGTGRKFAFSK